MESPTKKTLVLETAHSNLSPLIESILAESLAQACHFAEQNLETVGKQIEEVKETIGQPDAPAEWTMQKESYEKCVMLYCEILMELEQLQLPFPEGTLASLVEEKKEVSSSSKTKTASPLISVAGYEGFVEGQEAAPVGDIRNFKDLAEQLGFSSPTRVDETRSPLKTAIASQKPSSVLASSLSSVAAREHLELAHYFEGLKDSGSFPFSTHHINRLTDQSLCFCLETEFGEKMTPVISRFWPDCTTAIKSLLDPASTKFELHTALKSEIDRLASQNANWLLDGKFPYASALTSLRYMAGIPSPEKYRGSLLDYSLFLLFFSQDATINGLEMKNWIGADGLLPEQLIETGFRLSRVHKLRGQVISATSRVSEANRMALQEDVQTIITTLARISFRNLE